MPPMEERRTTVNSPDRLSRALQQLAGELARARRDNRRQRHELERMSSVMLVLRRGNIALKEENASLREELSRRPEHAFQ